MDAIICGAFQWRVSIDQIMRALKIPREQVEDGIRRGRYWIGYKQGRVKP